MKRPVLVAAAAVAAVAACVVVGYLIPMWGEHTEPPRSPEGPTYVVRGNAAPQVVGGGGSGIEGARTAAVAYATASQDWLYLTDDEVDRAVRTVTTERGAAVLTSQTVAGLRAARLALAGSPGRVWWLVRPLATRVDRADAASARVVVWTVTVLSASDVAVPQANWTRMAVDLLYVDGGWLVDAVTETPGPTPMTGSRDQPWQPEPFDAALGGFERVHDATVVG